MKTVPLKANLRDGVGKQKAKQIRLKKNIPAIVYGHGIKPTPIVVTQDDFQKVIHTKAGENVVIFLNIDGAKKSEKTVVIKEIQHNPVTDAIEHVDFAAISLTEKIKVKVPLHVKGEAPGLKEGGILDVVHHEVEVECLPTDIPEKIDHDISQMGIGDAVHVRELKFPAGVIPQLSADEVVIAIHAPKAEEVTPVAAEEAPSEPEVITKKKEEAEVEPAEPKQQEKPKPQEKTPEKK